MVKNYYFKKDSLIDINLESSVSPDDNNTVSDKEELTDNINLSGEFKEQYY